MSSLPPSINPSVLAARSAGAAQRLEIAAAFFVEDQLPWAREIAQEIRRDYSFRRMSQEAQDLEQVAYLVVVELAQRFDPARVPPDGNLVFAFRGWAAIEVRNRCRREARRLRNGGTYNTRRETRGQALVIAPLLKPREYVDPRTERRMAEMEEGEHDEI